MTSVANTYATRLTSSWITIGTYILGGELTSSMYLTPCPGLAQWAADNEDYLYVNGNQYIVVNPANYAMVIGNTGNGFWTHKYSAAFPEEGYFRVGTLFKDLGRDVYIGVPNEPNILHLRLMQAPGTLSSLGKGGLVGYGVVETNASDIFTESDGRTIPCVSLARGA
jgi:hypothetical protein